MRVICTVQECEHWNNAECTAEELVLSDHEVYFGNRQQLGHFWICNQCKRQVDNWIDLIKAGIAQLAAEGGE